MTEWTLFDDGAPEKGSLFWVANRVDMHPFPVSCAAFGINNGYTHWFPVEAPEGLPR
jgi:hypothetical protein